MTRDEEAALDRVDGTLLELLEADARTPIATLAAAVHLSPSAVRRRMVRLEHRGVIAGYTVRRPPIAFSRGAAAALLDVQLEGARCADLADAIDQEPTIRAIWSVAGEIDTVLLVEARDAAAVGELANRIAALAFVQRVTTRLVLKTLVDRRDSIGTPPRATRRAAPR